MNKLEKEYNKLATTEEKERKGKKDNLLSIIENIINGEHISTSCNSEKISLQVSSLISLAKEQEKAKAYYKAIDLYVEATDLAEPIDNFRLPRYSIAYNRLFILYSKTKQIEMEIELLRFLVDKYKNWTHPSYMKWVSRLEKKEASLKPKPIIKIKEHELSTPELSVPTFGERLQVAYSRMPKFNFYYDKSDNVETYEYLRDKFLPSFPKDLKKWHIQIVQIKRAFNNLLSIADAYDKTKNYKDAIEIYEELILERVPNTTPYERLLEIYKKLGWKQREVQLAKMTVDFFRETREKQIRNVLALSEEYNEKEKVMEYIRCGNKIQYYGGLFDIYNPFSVIKKLEEHYQI